MKPITHILDTSALLAHFFDEPGAETVENLWAAGSDLPGISAVTVAELRSVLHAEMTDDVEADDAVDRYLNELTICLPVDRAVAECAWQLKRSASRRVPLIDALIAATARTHGATLVHRDPHLRALPPDLVEQVELPAAKADR